MKEKNIWNICCASLIVDATSHTPCLFIVMQAYWGKATGQAHGPGNYFSESPVTSLSKLFTEQKKYCIVSFDIVNYLFSFTLYYICRKRMRWRLKMPEIRASGMVMILQLLSNALKCDSLRKKLFFSKYVFVALPQIFGGMSKVGTYVMMFFGLQF
jgi:hypothetical protein